MHPFSVIVSAGSIGFKIRIFVISVNLILTAYIASKVPYKIEGLRKLERPKDLRRRPAEAAKEEIIKKDLKEQDNNDSKRKIVNKRKLHKNKEVHKNNK